MGSRRLGIVLLPSMRKSRLFCGLVLSMILFWSCSYAQNSKRRCVGPTHRRSTAEDPSRIRQCLRNSTSQRGTCQHVEDTIKCIESVNDDCFNNPWFVGNLVDLGSRFSGSEKTCFQQNFDKYFNKDGQCPLSAVKEIFRCGYDKYYDRSSPSLPYGAGRCIIADLAKTCTMELHEPCMNFIQKALKQFFQEGVDGQAIIPDCLKKDFRQLYQMGWTKIGSKCVKYGLEHSGPGSKYADEICQSASARLYEPRTEEQYNNIIDFMNKAHNDSESFALGIRRADSDYLYLSDYKTLQFQPSDWNPSMASRNEDCIHVQRRWAGGAWAWKAVSCNHRNTLVR